MKLRCPSPRVPCPRPNTAGLSNVTRRRSLAHVDKLQPGTLCTFENKTIKLHKGWPTSRWKQCHYLVMKHNVFVQRDFVHTCTTSRWRVYFHHIVMNYDSLTPTPFSVLRIGATADAYLLRTLLSSKVLTWKTGVRQYMDMHATHTARNFFPLIYTHGSIHLHFFLISPAMPTFIVLYWRWITPLLV